MKKHLALAPLAALAVWACWQHKAFAVEDYYPISFQGQLQDGGSPANGSYDLTFTLFPTNSGGIAASQTITNSGVLVSNGLFFATLDFGTDTFNGTPSWLEIGVRSSGSNTDSFTTLAPRQLLTPSPSSIYAYSAGSAATATTAGTAASVAATGITGTISTNNLPPIIPITNLPGGGTVTITAGSGLSGGGSVSLGGYITMTNTGVLSVVSDGTVVTNAGITVVTSNGNVTLGLNSDTNPTPGTIVARNNSGNIAAAGLNMNFPVEVQAGGNTFIIGEGSLYMGYRNSVAAINRTPLFNTGFGDYALDFEAMGSSATGSTTRP